MEETKQNYKINQIILQMKSKKLESQLKLEWD